MRSAKISGKLGEEDGWSSVGGPPVTPSKSESGRPPATPSSAASVSSDGSWERVSQISSPAQDREVFASVKTEMKYVLVSGGVVSGIGKGLTASSLGVLFKSCGWHVTSIKIDPYVNCDAGTMSPFEHGEVYVLNDGGEVDLDLGNYERFLDVELCRDNNITTGKIFKHVIEKERRGEYDGKTVQMVPHLTDAIQEWVEDVARRPTDPSGEEPDVCIIELGGTVGDIENMPFIEALRQMMLRIGEENFCNCYVSLIPVIGVVGEQKTKPTQHGVKELRMLGMQPDILFCRGSEPMLQSTKAKLSMHCQVDEDAVISVHDVSNVYRIPLLMNEQGVTNLLIKKLQLVWKLPQRLPTWEALSDRMDACEIDCRIAIVGKYTGLSDAYLSVIKGLLHGAIAVNRKLIIDWVAAEDLEPSKKESEPDKSKAAWDIVEAANGLLVPGGFGVRGVDGKVEVCKYARESKKAILGICLGFQSMTIEAGRNLCGWEGANSTEFEEDNANPVVIFMPEVSKTHMGGTMRLGKRRTVLQPGCLTAQLYGDTEVDERHRHRYEVNIDKVPELEAKGLKFVGRDTTGERMEVIELDDHPFYVGTQYHPEFLSRPGRASPPFLGLMLAASGQLEEWKSSEEAKAKFRVEDPFAESYD